MDERQATLWLDGRVRPNQSSSFDLLDRLWVGCGSPSAVEIDARMAADTIGRLAHGESLPAHYVTSEELSQRIEAIQSIVASMSVSRFAVDPIYNVAGSAPGSS